MADTPDLSRIVSLIMENPDLIEQISALVKKETPEEEKTEEIKEEIPEQPKEMPITEESVPISAMPKRAKRNQLLGAMKPYLSDERSKAIDSMMSIADILEMMRGR